MTGGHISRRVVEQAGRQLSPGRDDHGGTRPGEGTAARIAFRVADEGEIADRGDSRGDRGLHSRQRVLDRQGLVGGDAEVPGGVPVDGRVRFAGRTGKRVLGAVAALSRDQFTQPGSPEARVQPGQGAGADRREPVAPGEPGQRLQDLPVRAQHAAQVLADHLLLLRDPVVEHGRGQHRACGLTVTGMPGGRPQSGLQRDTVGPGQVQGGGPEILASGCGKQVLGAVFGRYAQRGQEPVRHVRRREERRSFRREQAAVRVEQQHPQAIGGGPGAHRVRGPGRAATVSGTAGAPASRCDAVMKVRSIVLPLGGPRYPSQ